MKSIATVILLFALSSLGGCQTSPIKTIKASEVDVSGPVEITRYEINKTPSNYCSIQGTLIDENGEGMFGMVAKLNGSELGSICDLDGAFKIENVPSGSYTLELKQVGIKKCTIQIELETGDELKIEAGIARYGGVIDLKPIIYLYPEVITDINVQLSYDGKLTTTYPKYPENGWEIKAQPDGTLIDENGRKYYALYWEGEPREALGISEGFVVSKEETITFLEKKLELLGLNEKETNEFIIFWLPMLKKNPFNLIHFSGEDYLKKAQLNISPTPDTEIRISMIFQGLDEEIDFPKQDLSPLYKTRKGFTIVEWGGQQLSKNTLIKV